MAEKQKLEIRISAALKNFVETKITSSKVVLDLSLVIKATSELPLANIEYWERYIRNEYDNALTSCYSYGHRFEAHKTIQVTLLDLCSWDGHRREKALRVIAGKMPNRFFLALVLRRLNDWVPQVRQAAQDVLSKVLVKTEPSYVVDVICFTLSHWSSWKRIDYSYRKVLIDTLSNKEITNQLKLKLINSTSGPLTTIISEVGRTNIFDNYMKEIATNAIQPSLRAKVYRSLLEGRMTWFKGREWEWTYRQYNEGRMKTLFGERALTLQIQLLPTLLSAANDRSSVVRRVAAEILIKELDNIGDESADLAEKLSKDHSNTVSERGKFALKKLAGETLF